MTDFVFPNATDYKVLADIQALDQRIDGLTQCAQRLGVEQTDQASWTAVLSDLIALAGAFHMAVKEVVPRLQTKAVVPWSPSLDINLYNEIPNLLSVIREPDDARELAEIPVTQPLSIKADIVKRKLRAQDMMIMDAIRGIEQAAQKWSPPLSQLTNSVSSRLTPFQIQKQTEAVQNVIAAIHSGTNREQY